MNLSISMQSLKNVFRFPFYDPKWQNKLLIGSLLGFANWIIPIVPLLPVLGYFARVLRAGARNEDPANLPEWDDWGDLFMDGLRQFGVSFLAFLPSTIIFLAAYAVYMVLILSMSSIEQSGGTGPALATVFGAMLVLFVGMAVGMLLFLLSALVMPPAAAHVAVQRRFSAAFEFGRWWGILKANFLGFMVALGIFVVIYSLMLFITQILYMTLIFCCLVPFVLMPLTVYGGIILYRLLGQAYGEAAPAAVDAAPEAPAF